MKGAHVPEIRTGTGEKEKQNQTPKRKPGLESPTLPWNERRENEENKRRKERETNQGLQMELGDH